MRRNLPSTWVVFTAYVSTALWSSTDDNDRPMDAKYGMSDLAPETMAAMRRDCTRFVQGNRRDINIVLADGILDWGGIGHNFWLTRNRHGAGFWDYDTSSDEVNAALKRLTSAAHAYGSSDLYVGDDGKVYVT